ncbi:unnamed protein product [Rhizoctonia solani]|uniref:Uncharacterized protein n=1 Tax=Rhizoctonia solani TaxID=456999 RepID=A0A8H2WRK7_9AGAM|nr:unnamed protein product [Rhizoctonia solani]
MSFVPSSVSLLVMTSINHHSASQISHSQSQTSQLSPIISSPSSILSPQPPTNISFESDHQRPSDESRIYTAGSSIDHYPTHESESHEYYLGPDDNVWRHTSSPSARNIATFTGSSIHPIDKTGYRFYRNPDTSVVATEFITSRYTHAYSLQAIELASHLESFVQVCILPNITLSQSACWSLYIGAKIYDTAMSSHGSKIAKQYIQTLDQFGQQIYATNLNGMTPRELSGWLMAALELTELRCLIDPQLCYRTHRLAIPIFMQLARTEPTVWRNHNSGPSLHRISLSHQPGLTRFAVMDVFGSFVLGHPQMIVWDPVFIPELAHFPWDEWIPGFPLYSLLALSAINSWREQDPYTRNPNEWVQYERNILDWSAQHIGRSDRSDHSDSWRTVGRLAIQEAFHHMTLIYLYMGMGGLKSGNPRVQVSCSQISQLCGLIDSKPDLAVSLFFASMIAGVCAIDEKQRSVLRNTGSSVVWLSK